MSRHFTLEEAERLLPELERSLREAVRIKAHFEQAEAELRDSAERVALLGGARVDQEKLLAQRGRRDALAARLREAVEAVEAHGCLVKDLEIGLIDFPTFFRTEEVCLCWRLGEPGIRYWHGLHEGFQGRKLIDAEFRDNHRGDLPS